MIENESARATESHFLPHLKQGSYCVLMTTLRLCRNNIDYSFTSIYIVIASWTRDMSASSHQRHPAKNEDFESITRIHDTGSLLLCPICKKDIQDPRILCSNGHTFCHDCLTVGSSWTPLEVASPPRCSRRLCQKMGFSSVQCVVKHVVCPVFRKSDSYRRIIRC